MGKKSFKDKINPTMSFISQESIDNAERAPADQILEKTEPKPARSRKAPAGYKPNPEYIEKRTRRVQMLIQPSLYDLLKAKAEAEGISTNEAINKAIEEYIER